MSTRTNDTSQSASDQPYVTNPDAAKLIAVFIQTAFFPATIPDCMTGYWPLALAEIQSVADTTERERFHAFSSFTADLPPEQSWGMMNEVRGFLMPMVRRTEKDRQLYWAKDAMSPPPELEWVVPGLFARPSLNILVGDPGSKKTYLAMDLAVCIANGIPWLNFATNTPFSISGKRISPDPLPHSVISSQGASVAFSDAARREIPLESIEHTPQLELDQPADPRESSLGVSRVDSPTRRAATQPPLPVESGESSFGDSSPPLSRGGVWGGVSSPVPVLFIDEESGYLQIWSRFNSILHAHNSDPGAPLAYTSLAGYNLRDPEDADALIKRVLSIKAGLVIIDALSDLLSTTDTNSSIQPVLFNLRRIADTCHCAVLVIHHTNREGGYRGSSSIAAAVDLMLEVSSPSSESTIEIRNLKARFKAPDPFCALAHFDSASSGDPRFHLTASTEKPAPKTKSPLTDASQGTAFSILQILEKNPGATRKQISSHLPTTAQSTIRNVLHQLTQSRSIKRADHGGKGTEASYELTD